jgi:hypothetical protein
MSWVHLIIGIVLLTLLFPKIAFVMGVSIWLF